MSLDSQSAASPGFPHVASHDMARRLLCQMAVVFAEDAQLFAADLERGKLGVVSASEVVLLFAKKLRAVASDIEPPSSSPIFD
jgi:hypothetical protein